jgi:cytoskeletal protein RodZ
MTMDELPRRASRRAVAKPAVPEVEEGSGPAVRVEPPEPPLTERLRAAREAKGLDFYRIERDTKIRAKYLAALEDGDDSALPGDVYTKGFLRNYASYLGLDSDDVVDQWRRERGEGSRHSSLAGPQPMSLAGPQPIFGPPRRLVFQRNHIFIGLLVAVVAAVGLYFGYQVTRFLEQPSLGVSQPLSETVTVSVGTSTYDLRGTATPGTTVLISWNGENPKSVVVDGAGNWSFTASLEPGRNQFDVLARNMDTKHDSGTLTRIINVPEDASGGNPTLTLDSPLDGGVFQDGLVTVRGKTSGVTTVTVTPTYLGPPGSASASPKPTPTRKPGASPSPGPSPTTVLVRIDGTFIMSMQLSPGRWEVAVAGSSSDGLRTPTVSRVVTVGYKGLQVVVQIEGAAPYLKIWRDGVVDGSLTKTYKDGSTIMVSGSQSVWIKTSNAAATYITVNGVSYGQLRKAGGWGSWRIDKNGPQLSYDN